MDYIVALVARKGGVGKTTIAANLAGELEAFCPDVRVIDADPQRSLLLWASVGQGFLSSRVVAAAEEAELRQRVAGLRGQNRLVVIDTAPGYSESAMTAIRIADLILLPCGASPLDLAATRDIVAVCRGVHDGAGAGKKPKIGLIPSRYLPNSSLGRELASSLSEFGERTLPGVAHRVAIAEAALEGLTVREFARASTAHQEFAKLAEAVWRYLSE